MSKQNGREAKSMRAARVHLRDCPMARQDESGASLKALTWCDRCVVAMATIARKAHL